MDETTSTGRVPGHTVIDGPKCVPARSSKRYDPRHGSNHRRLLLVPPTRQPSNPPTLQPAGPAELAERTRATGVSAVQLALDPLRRGDWSLDETDDILGQAGLVVRSGMMSSRGEDYSSLETIALTASVRLDEHWGERLRQRIRDTSGLARVRASLES